jgi:hypothetical protein
MLHTPPSSGSGTTVQLVANITKWTQPHPHPTKLNKGIGVFDELERIWKEIVITISRYYA